MVFPSSDGEVRVLVVEDLVGGHEAADASGQAGSGNSPAEQLARRGPGQARRRSRPASGPCRSASEDGQWLAQIFLRGLGAVRQDDQGADGLLPLGIRAPDHRCVRDRGVGDQHRLDLGGHHVLAARHDHLAAAAR